MTWQPSDPDRRSHSNPGLSGDVGELRGVLNTHLTQQMQLWSRFQDELRDQAQVLHKRVDEVNVNLAAISAWKSEMTGGMKVAAIIWRAWVAVMSGTVAWLTYLRIRP